MSEALKIVTELLCLTQEQVASLKSAVYNAPSLFAYPADEILDALRMLQQRPHLPPRPEKSKKPPSPRSRTSTTTRKDSSSSEILGQESLRLPFEVPRGALDSPQVKGVLEKSLEALPHYTPRSKGGPLLDGKPIKETSQKRSKTPRQALPPIKPEILKLLETNWAGQPVPMGWEIIPCVHQECPQAFIYPTRTHPGGRNPTFCYRHLLTGLLKVKRAQMIDTGLQKFGDPFGTSA